MLDLKKIQDRFDRFFNEETEETFNEWLSSKLTKEVLLLLGNGKIEELKASISTAPNIECPKIISDFNEKHSPYTCVTPYNESQYALAA